MHAIVWGSESCDCNKDDYDRRHAMCLCNHEIYCFENTAQSLLLSCAVVSAALEVSHTPAQRSHLLHNLTILIVMSGSFLNAPPKLEVLSGAPENALAESESTLQCSRGVCEHLEVLGSAGEGYRSVWDVCVRLPDWFTFCWLSRGWWGVPWSR